MINVRPLYDPRPPSTPAQCATRSCSARSSQHALRPPWRACHGVRAPSRSNRRTCQRWTYGRRRGVRRARRAHRRGVGAGSRRATQRSAAAVQRRRRHSRRRSRRRTLRLKAALTLAVRSHRSSARWQARLRAARTAHGARPRCAHPHAARADKLWGAKESVKGAAGATSDRAHDAKEQAKHGAWRRAQQAEETGESMARRAKGATEGGGSYIGGVRRLNCAPLRKTERSSSLHARLARARSRARAQCAVPASIDRRARRQAVGREGVGQGHRQRRVRPRARHEGER